MIDIQYINKIKRAVRDNVKNGVGIDLMLYLLSKRLKRFGLNYKDIINENIIDEDEAYNSWMG